MVTEIQGKAELSVDDLPLAALDAPDMALAVIVAIEGPSYRPLGAAMAIPAEGPATGNVSSGCIEQDLILHARRALKDGECRTIRYGLGSPFRDLELPCGGGLDILILPRPDRAVLRHVIAELEQRRPAQLWISRKSGAFALGEVGTQFTLTILPKLRFLVFGKGAEAHAFASLVDGLGYDIELFSPDDVAHPLTSSTWPEGLMADARTAVLLFFHDHDWEPNILQGALQTEAFFIGAQGSLRASLAREAALVSCGVPRAQIARLRAPFGLIPSVRDPRTLSVSVLADVLAEVALR
jgi:xanthine dehydrogenase accessory factor